jgi:hypothetical protein
MPGPKPPKVVLADKERHELERLVCRRKTSQALVRRARVVLRTALDYPNVEIARHMPKDEEAVGLWRRRKVSASGWAPRSSQGATKVISVLVFAISTILRIASWQLSASTEDPGSPLARQLLGAGEC